MTHRFFPAIIAAIMSLIAASAAHAATSALYKFDATLASGTVLCGPFVGLEAPCPSLFGTVDEGNSYDDLMLGMSIGGTYSGQIELFYDQVNGQASLSGGTCSLNGRNCAFGQQFLPLGSGLLGASPGVLDFGLSSVVGSSFNLTGATGTYGFGTDYLFRPDGSVYYYSGVNFDLKNVNHSVVPLPASLPFLLVSLGGFAYLRRKRS